MDSLHLKEYMFSCELCDKRFNLKTALTKHLNVVHKENKKRQELFKCNFCEKLFTKRNLKRHVETVHERVRLSCDICESTFQRVDYLKSHMKSMHSKSRCSFCGKTFMKEESLEVHKNKAHQDFDQKLFKCHTCYIGFNSNGHLKTHVETIHNKIRKYKCDNCNKSFKRTHHLKYHLDKCTSIPLNA